METADRSNETPEPGPKVDPSQPRQASSSLKHVFFDFDQTISRCHVFMQLAGFGDEQNQFVPPPFATSERGQICKIGELNSSHSWLYEEAKNRILVADPGERWTCAALGGDKRVKALRSLFNDLQAKGALMTIITKGCVGAVRRILFEEGLLDFFAEVYGNIGSIPYGATDYDKTQVAESTFEGSADSAGWQTKASLVQILMARGKLKKPEAVLVEDDIAEIASVRGICRQVYVEKRRGMTAAEMDRIRKFAGVETNAAQTAVTTASVAVEGNLFATPDAKRRKT